MFVKGGKLSLFFFHSRARRVSVHTTSSVVSQEFTMATET